MTPAREQPFSPAFEAGMDARVCGAPINTTWDDIVSPEDWSAGWKAADAILRKVTPIVPRAPHATWEPAGPGTVRLPVPGGWIYHVSVIGTTTTVAVFVPEPK